MSIVQERLNAEFATLMHKNDSINGMIEKCARLAKTFFDEIPQEDAVEEALADDDSNGEESEEELDAYEEMVHENAQERDDEVDSEYEEVWDF